MCVVWVYVRLCVCVLVYVRVCVRVCLRACVCMCLCVSMYMCDKRRGVCRYVTAGQRKQQRSMRVRPAIGHVEEPPIWRPMDLVLADVDGASEQPRTLG